jgi:hypothetical protein
MKYLLFLLLFPIFCFADIQSNELVLGSLTYHLIDGPPISNKFQNQVSPDGRLIDNFLIGFSHIDENNEHEYFSYTLFTGENSLAKPIGGFKLSTGKTDGGLYIGIVTGAYFQNNRDFTDQDINGVLTSVDWHSTGLVPIVGMEINYVLFHIGDIYLKLNNILTPVLTNHTFSIGQTF